jgi:hypothetical protein
MSSLNTAIYAGDAFNPVNIAGNTADIQGSGFSTIILGLCHIGRGPDAYDPVQGQQTGDFVFNNPNQNSTDCDRGYRGTKTSAAYDAALVAGLNS